MNVGYQIHVTRWYAAEGRQQWDSVIFDDDDDAQAYAVAAIADADAYADKCVVEVWQTEDGTRQTFIRTTRTER